MKSAPRHFRQFQSVAAWADAVSIYLSDKDRPDAAVVSPSPILLARRGNSDIDAKATEDGLLIYNALTGTPEYSKGGEWLPITYTPPPAATKTYGGAAVVSGSGIVNVSFPQEFSAAPAVTVTALSQNDDDAIIAELVSVAVSGFSAKLKKISSTFDGTVSLTAGSINWIAFGQP